MRRSKGSVDLGRLQLCAGDAARSKLSHVLRRELLQEQGGDYRVAQRQVHCAPLQWSSIHARWFQRKYSNHKRGPNQIRPHLESGAIDWEIQHRCVRAFSSRQFEHWARWRDERNGIWPIHFTIASNVPLREEGQRLDKCDDRAKPEHHRAWENQLQWLWFLVRRRRFVGDLNGPPRACCKHSKLQLVWQHDGVPSLQAANESEREPESIKHRYEEIVEF